MVNRKKALKWCYSKPIPNQNDIRKYSLINQIKCVWKKNQERIQLAQKMKEYAINEEEENTNSITQQSHLKEEKK